MEASTSPVTVTLPPVTDRMPEGSDWEFDADLHATKALVDVSNLMGHVHALHTLPILDMDGLKDDHRDDLDEILVHALRLYRDVVLACPPHIEFPEPMGIEVYLEKDRLISDVSLVDDLCVRVARFHYDLHAIRLGNKAAIDAHTIVVAICTLLCGAFDDDEIRFAYDNLVKED